MKQLINTLILVSAIGITYLFTANKENHGKSMQKQYETHEEPASKIKAVIDLPSEVSADTNVPVMYDILTGKNMKYWIY